mgnify:CR=1 FL=1
MIYNNKTLALQHINVKKNCAKNLDKLCEYDTITKDFATVQSQAKFYKADVKCLHF